MHGIASYEIGTGRTFDEDGDEICLEFCIADTTNENETGYVAVDGELHCCRDFSLFGNLLSFWVRPAPSWATLRNIIALDPPTVGENESAAPPAATPTGDLTADTGTGPTDALNYQTVVDAFNRLAKLESEGHHSGQTFYIAETVWALLTAQGVVIDIDRVDCFLNYYGQMTDDLFHEMNVQSLADSLEVWATSLGGEA